MQKACKVIKNLKLILGFQIKLFLPIVPFPKQLSILMLIYGVSNGNGIFKHEYYLKK